jgi:hypothetical protein
MVQLRKVSSCQKPHHYFSTSQQNEYLSATNNNNNNTIQMSILNENNNVININNSVDNNNNNNNNSIVNNEQTNNNNNNNNNTMNLLPAQSQIQQQFEEALANPINLEWINKEWIQRIVRICALFSFISICANTPETFKNYKIVMILTYVTDLISTLVFTIEMLAKIKIKGLFRGESAYIFDRWCQFDGIMVIFHIISVVLQVRI